MRFVLPVLLLASTAVADPTPDPITKPLSEQQARGEASRLARAAWDKQKDIKGADGKRPNKPAYPADRFTVKHEANRWTLTIDPPAGAWAHVSFGDFGDHVKVDVGFATH